MALSSFYRPEALEHLAQREQIDSLAKVTVPCEWWALMLLAVACAAIAGWSVFGKIERTVRADVLIVVPDDRRAVVAPADGRITESLVDPGDQVNEGEPLARLEIPELDRRLSAARERERVIVQELTGAAPDAGVSRMLIDARAEVAGLTAMIARDSVIASPYAGEVFAHRLSPGAIVTAGEEVARVRVGPSAAPIAVASLAPARAGTVQPGAPARLHCGGARGAAVLETTVGDVSPRPGAMWARLADSGPDPGDRHVLLLALPDAAAVAGGDACEAHIVTGTLSPLQLLLTATGPR